MISIKLNLWLQGNDNDLPELVFPQVREDIHVIEVAVDGVQVLQ